MPATKKSSSKTRNSATKAKGRTGAARKASSRAGGASPRSKRAAASGRGKSQGVRKAPARSKRNLRTNPGRSSSGRVARGNGKSGEITIDHDEIRQWVESRGGRPATVSGTERGSEAAGLLRIDFPGYSGEQSLSALDWDEFFEKFEEAKLAFLYDTDKGSKFNKFIARGKKRF